jgi:hypothetical protein
MTINPNSPVLVGGGQINDHVGGRSPVVFIAAAEAGSDGLLRAVDSVPIVGLLSLVALSRSWRAGRAADRRESSPRRLHRQPRQQPADAA